MAVSSLLTVVFLVDVCYIFINVSFNLNTDE